MNIYSIVDHTNLEKIIIMFNSVYLNSSSKNLNFYILTDKEQTEFIKIPGYLNLKIKNVEFDNNWEPTLHSFNRNFYKGSSWCKHDMNFGRFLFFKYFPYVERVIYLDWDMLVIGDIYNLKEYYDLIDQMIVSETQINLFYSNIFTKTFQVPTNLTFEGLRRNLSLCRKLHMIFQYMNMDLEKIFQTKGFNSGFYIVSREHFEENYVLGLIRKIILIQKKFNCFNFGTQVIMNLMNINNRLFVSRSWNNFANNIEGYSSSNIIHWCGKNKPWDSEFAPFQDLWKDYYELVFGQGIIYSPIKTFDDGNFVYVEDLVEEKDDTFSKFVSSENNNVEEENKAIIEKHFTKKEPEIIQVEGNIDKENEIINDKYFDNKIKIIEDQTEKKEKPKEIKEKEKPEKTKEKESIEMKSIGVNTEVFYKDTKKVNSSKKRNKQLIEFIDSDEEDSNNEEIILVELDEKFNVKNYISNMKKVLKDFYSKKDKNKMIIKFKKI